MIFNLRSICVPISILLSSLILPPQARAWSQQAATAAPRQILVLWRLGPEHFRPGSDYGGGYGDALSRSAREHAARRVARAHDLTLVGDWPMPLLGVDCFIMAVPEGRSPEAAAASVSQDPNVAWSEPMHIYQAKGEARKYNDPLYPAQPATSEWHLADLHQLATGRGATVAIIDSKIERTHPDLAGQMTISEDFAPEHPAASEQHGTGVAGIIAAKAENGLGIVGIAPRAHLMGLRACWQLHAQAAVADSTICDSLSLAKALHFAIEHDARVINLSLSGPPDRLLGSLLDIGLARGTTVVAAFDQSLSGGGFPASHPGVIAVSGESLFALPRGVYSAPGRGVPTTQPGGRWNLVNGSSYAAAHVSGLIALLRERHIPVGGSSFLVSGSVGGGAIDACASLLRSKPCDCACAFASRASPYLRR